jgi:hypothetical protein
VASKNTRTFGAIKPERFVHCGLHVAGERLLGVAEGQIQDGASAWLHLIWHGCCYDVMLFILVSLLVDNSPCNTTHIMPNHSRVPHTHHKSSFPSFTFERIPPRALIEGVKKYSPPLGITNGLTAFSFTALLASCGNMPVMFTSSLLLS